MNLYPALYGKRIFLSGLLLGCLSTSGNAASIFNFDGDPIGQGTPFTDTSNGLSATFSSPGDPGGFGVNAGFFSALSGNVLIDPGPAGLDNLALNIVFGSSVDSIGLDFAVNSASPAPLTLTAFQNGATVGTITATDAFPSPGAQAPEGHIDFSGAGFNSVTLTSSAGDFAIDNVTVTSATAAPEPATLGLLSLAGALASFGIMVKRLRRR